ncbi:MAG: hypothetical protein B5M56_08425 [Desulfococcus sp. 4484_241]|nr:MAG: hypothetical protein B5M56_08425 [Desulfococcus sp. 4484_241]
MINVPQPDNDTISIAIRNCFMILFITLTSKNNGSPLLIRILVLIRYKKIFPAKFQVSCTSGVKIITKRHCF